MRRFYLEYREAIPDMSGMVSGMSFLVNFPEDKMTAYVMIIIILITISNIIAARIVYGGDRYIFYLFGALFFTVSGLLVILAPLIVGFFFTIPVPTGV